MKPLAAVVACLLFASSAAFAQGVGSSGEIRGTVTDPSGAVLPNTNVTVVNEQTAFQRLDLTNQLLSQANDALDLAEQRYNLGLSSIVELSQAQLNQTRAQIEQTTAKYEYQMRHATLQYQTGALK